MDEYLDVKIDIFEHTDQRARIRRSLTVNHLIEEILKEFDDISRNSIEKYAIYLKGTDHPLDRNSTVTDLDLQPQDELVFEYKHQTILENLLPEQYACLYEVKTGKTFDIQWQPAVIGRPTAEAEHNMMLAVNVQFIPNGMTISRRHAQITFSNNHYYLEPLTENNPVFVNDVEVPYNSRAEVKNNDKLTFGNQKVIMTFMARQHASADARGKPIPPAAQPVQTKPKPVSDIQPESKLVPPLPLPSQPSADGVSRKQAASYPGGIPAASMVIEQATSKDQIGQRISLTTYPCILGRNLPSLSAENGVSRQHINVNYDIQSKLFILTDLNSTNGVKIEGAPIIPDQPYEIKSGMHITLGEDVLLRFEVG